MNINTPLQGRGLAIPWTKANNTSAELDHEDLRLPFLNKVPDALRNHFIAMTGEFVGTVLFLWFALSGAQVANSIPSSSGLTVEQTGSNPQQLQYIALSFGFSLAVNAWVFFRISGGLFDPAVTFGMCLIGALPWIRGGLLFIAQVLGGLVASALVQCMFPGALNVQTKLGGGTSVAQGLFIEMFLTAQLVFTIFMLAAEKHKGTFIAPVGIGLSLFVAEMTGVFFTGGSLNPARSFGPAVIDSSFVHYHWIYWLGPTLGSIVAAGFYKFIKILEYETANPDQDAANQTHTSLLQNRKDLLMAAGLSEEDATEVATGLQGPDPLLTGSQTSEKTVIENLHGGPDGKVVANGQGRSSEEHDRVGPMYGTGFRNDSAATASSSPPMNQSLQEETPAPLQRPAADAGAVGRYSHLAKHSGHPHKFRHLPLKNLGHRGRINSPMMPTHDDVHSGSLEDDMALGGGVMSRVMHRPKNKLARTGSNRV